MKGSCCSVSGVGHLNFVSSFLIGLVLLALVLGNISAFADSNSLCYIRGNMLYLFHPLSLYIHFKYGVFWPEQGVKFDKKDLFLKGKSLESDFLDVVWTMGRAIRMLEKILQELRKIDKEVSKEFVCSTQIATTEIERFIRNAQKFTKNVENFSKRTKYAAILYKYFEIVAKDLSLALKELNNCGLYQNVLVLWSPFVERKIEFLNDLPYELMQPNEEIKMLFQKKMDAFGFGGYLENGKYLADLFRTAGVEVPVCLGGKDITWKVLKIIYKKYGLSEEILDFVVELYRLWLNGGWSLR